MVRVNIVVGEGQSRVNYGQGKLWSGCGGGGQGQGVVARMC